MKDFKNIAEYPFASRFFEQPNHRIHYLDEGEGEVVVMVHGNPTWSYYYRNLIAELRKTKRVIAIDHLGCGLSDKPQDYDYCLANHIENLDCLLQHLQLDRFSLILHDWGGAIGMGVAGRRPGAVQKIVVMNTAAFRSTRIPKRISLCRLPILGEILVRGFNGFAAPATVMAVANTMRKEVAKGYLAPYDSWRNRIAIHRFVADIPLAPTDKSYRTLTIIEEQLPVLRQRKIPILVLWGAEDFCFDGWFYNQWLSRFPECERVWFKDGGHYLLEDKPKDCLARIEAFLG